MYQPYPGGTQTPEPTPRPSAPKSVVRAVYAMYVGAAASLVGIIIDLAEHTTIEKRLETAAKHPMSTSQAHAAIIELVVVQLIAVGLWIWMALSCKAGKGWARIVSTVLFGLDTLDVIVSAALPTGGGVRLYGLLVWVIGLVAIIFLWLRPSSAYFKGTPQY